MRADRALLAFMLAPLVVPSIWLCLAATKRGLPGGIGVAFAIFAFGPASYLVALLAAPAIWRHAVKNGWPTAWWLALCGSPVGIVAGVAGITLFSPQVSARGIDFIAFALGGALAAVVFRAIAGGQTRHSRRLASEMVV